MYKAAACVLAMATTLTLLSTSIARTATTSDALHLISLTTSMVAKTSSAGSSQVHVTKIALTDSYAIVDWEQGRNSGEKIFQKRYEGTWHVLASGAIGSASPGTLAIYSVPSTTATALAAGMRQCPSPQKVVFHGLSTSVCFVGPCSVCERTLRSSG